MWKLNDQELLHDAYIALGSNIGDKERNLTAALKLLKEVKDKIQITGISNIYETEPVGYIGQDNFLNMVCRIYTSLKPLELLFVLQEIEIKLGRKRDIRWGPRTLDLDLLLYDNINICSERLTVPHPRMFERAFVLVPLRDVFPFEQITGRTLDDLIEKCEDRSGVKLFKAAKLISGWG